MQGADDEMNYSGCRDAAEDSNMASQGESHPGLQEIPTFLLLLQLLKAAIKKKLLLNNCYHLSRDHLTCQGYELGNKMFFSPAEAV